MPSNKSEKYLTLTNVFVVVVFFFSVQEVIILKEEEKFMLQ